MYINEYTDLECGADSLNMPSSSKDIVKACSQTWRSSFLKKKKCGLSIGNFGNVNGMLLARVFYFSVPERQRTAEGCFFASEETESQKLKATRLTWETIKHQKQLTTLDFHHHHHSEFVISLSLPSSHKPSTLSTCLPTTHFLHCIKELIIHLDMHSFITVLLAVNAAITTSAYPTNSSSNVVNGTVGLNTTSPDEVDTFEGLNLTAGITNVTSGSAIDPSTGLTNFTDALSGTVIANLSTFDLSSPGSHHNNMNSTSGEANGNLTETLDCKIGQKGKYCVGNPTTDSSASDLTPPTAGTKLQCDLGPDGEYCLEVSNNSSTDSMNSSTSLDSMPNGASPTSGR